MENIVNMKLKKKLKWVYLIRASEIVLLVSLINALSYYKSQSILLCFISMILILDLLRNI